MGSPVEKESESEVSAEVELDDGASELTSSSAVGDGSLGRLPIPLDPARSRAHFNVVRAIDIVGGAFGVLGHLLDDEGFELGRVLLSSDERSQQELRQSLRGAHKPDADAVAQRKASAKRPRGGGSKRSSSSPCAKSSGPSESGSD